MTEAGLQKPWDSSLISTVTGPSEKNLASLRRPRRKAQKASSNLPCLGLSGTEGTGRAQLGSGPPPLRWEACPFFVGGLTLTPAEPRISPFSDLSLHHSQKDSLTSHSRDQSPELPQSGTVIVASHELQGKGGTGYLYPQGAVSPHLLRGPGLDGWPGLGLLPRGSEAPRSDCARDPVR